MKREGSLSFLVSNSRHSSTRDADKVDALHIPEIRMVMITYNEAEVAVGLKESRDMRLTRFGVSVVGRMNKPGMATDLSYATDQMCLATCGVSSDPVFVFYAAHARCGRRTTWNPTTRSLETVETQYDETLEACRLIREGRESKETEAIFKSSRLERASPRKPLTSS